MLLLVFHTVEFKRRIEQKWKEVKEIEIINSGIIRPKRVHAHLTK